MAIWKLGTVFVLMAPLLVTGANAQTVADTDSVKQQLDALRASQAAIQRELQDIKTLLQRLNTTPPAAASPMTGAEISLKDAQFKGATRTNVVFVEFSDFQCPFCGAFANSSYLQITREYIDTGRLRYAFMNFPIESIHPLAWKQHLAAACAADQGRF